MVEVQSETRRPGRPKRDETTNTERRRRSGGIASKLNIPPEVLKAHPDMEFRWGRDDGDRMQRLTQNDDWDKVPGVEPIHGGKGVDGKGMQQHLLMKPKWMMEQDRAEKLAAVDTRIQTQFARPTADQGTGADGLYSVPGNKLTEA
jgi:hypothetical protein